MKKLTFIGSVVLSVICLIFTYSYAETYHKDSKQYEMCFQDNSLSTYEKIIVTMLNIEEFLHVF